MVCQFLLYNKVNQLYVYIYPHIPSLLRLPPTLPIPPLQVVSKHQADLPVLCSCFPLAIYFTFGSVYMSMLLSHLVPAYPSPFLCPQVHSLRLRLYSCPAPRFFRTMFFFFSIPYICVSIQYLFFLVPRPGIKPTSPALEGRFFTTGQPGKSQAWCSAIVGVQ